MKQIKSGRNKVAQLERRKSALARLENQLKSGFKTEKVAQLTLVTTGANQIPLTEEDITRIKKEISILKQRV